MVRFGSAVSCFFFVSFLFGSVSLSLVHWRVFSCWFILFLLSFSLVVLLYLCFTSHLLSFLFISSFVLPVHRHVSFIFSMVLYVSMTFITVLLISLLVLSVLVYWPYLSSSCLSPLSFYRFVSMFFIFSLVLSVHRLSSLYPLWFPLVHWHVSSSYSYFTFCLCPYLLPLCLSRLWFSRFTVFLSFRLFLLWSFGFWFTDIIF